MRKRLFLPLVAVVVLSSASALAQWSKGGSLFTQDGIEISVDPRVFAVFAMLNGIGYDEETVHGPPPLHAPQFADARKSARNRMGRPGTAVRSFEEVVKKHPLEADAYVDAALRMGPAPSFDVPKGAPKLTKAMATPASAWFNEEGGAAIYRQVAGELTDDQKRLLDPIDAVGKKLTKAARLGSDEDALLEEDAGASGRVVVVLNPLDKHGALHRVSLGDMTYVVTGPQTDKKAIRDVVNAAAVAFARTLVARDVEKQPKTGAAADLYGKLDADTRKAFSDKDAFATELVACALVRAVEKGATCTASPLEKSDVVAAAWPELEARMQTYLKDDSLMLLGALPAILAPLPAAPLEAAAAASDVKKATAPAKKK